VDFVQHNKGEILKKSLPVVMMGQDSTVQHIRIGEENLRDIFPDLFSAVGRGVSIVDFSRDLCAFNPFKPEGKIFQLVLFEGLEGKDVDRLGFSILQDFLDDSNVIDQALAARRFCGHKEVRPIPKMFYRLCLMAVKLSQTELFHGFMDVSMKRHLWAVVGLTGRQVTVVYKGIAETWMGL